MVHSQEGCNHPKSSRDISRSFSRDDLAQANVISQVDRKFIACLVGDANGKETLVLIDQHAADERIRVERFLKELFVGFLDQESSGVEVRVLDPPVPVLLSRREAKRLVESEISQSALSAWGIRFRELQPSRTWIEDLGRSATDDYAQVFVTCLPDVVSNKVSFPFSLQSTF